MSKPKNVVAAIGAALAVAGAHAQSSIQIDPGTTVSGGIVSNSADSQQNISIGVLPGGISGAYNTVVTPSPGASVAGNANVLIGWGGINGGANATTAISGMTGADYAVSIGYGSQATEVNSLAVGAWSTATAPNAVSIGANTANAEANTVAIGGRRLTQVGDAVNLADAVNLGQTTQIVTDAVNASAASINDAMKSVSQHMQRMSNLGGSMDLSAGRNNNASFGTGAIVTGSGSVSIGAYAQTGKISYDQNWTPTVTTQASNATAIGLYARAQGDGAFAGGAASRAAGNNSVAIGYTSLALSDGGIAIGQNATAVMSNSVAIGAGARAQSSVAVGTGAGALGTNTTAVGDNATASGNYAVALGNNAQATASNSIALGNGSQTEGRANTVSVGTAGQERQITNVADGTAATDAVNVRQLNNAIAAIPGLAGGASQADLDKLSGRVSTLEGTVSQLRRQAYGGIAAAAALAQPAVFARPGAAAVTAGVAEYQGSGAVAVAYNKLSGDGNKIYSAGMAASSGGGVVMRAGMSFSW